MKQVYMDKKNGMEMVKLFVYVKERLTQLVYLKSLTINILLLVFLMELMVQLNLLRNN